MPFTFVFLGGLSHPVAQVLALPDDADQNYIIAGMKIEVLEIVIAQNALPASTT
ncbi:hypothetical protein [Cellvibrio sp. KY-GH-1]|uniref:hypothetical protein n=1 Tax=Cellvibrio sp. KY-GH-1 TaxID=2303332 RepID=UPI0017846D38|nr:hypothetical protein [Cellvibrio sp. KY-GH-1]